MIFNTWLFALFAIIIFALYTRVKSLQVRSFFIIGAGIIFYMASVPQYILLVAALAVITYGTARLMRRLPPAPSAKRKWVLTAGIVANLGALGFFKYGKLFGTTLGICQTHCADTLSHIIVPLAISFFTFEFIHFLVDIYLGKIEDFEALDFFTFAFFFPTMIAGPIKRFQNFAPQLWRFAHLHSIQVAAGIFRILLGLAKKGIIADSMAPLTQPLLNPQPIYSTADYWIAAIAFSAKIYFDFCGYSDIAIGLAELLGFRILENFERPFWAQNVSQFWQRWHISLSSWVRDYLFIPLGGSRQKPLRAIANLAFVMAIVGLWHGASWHFPVYGLSQGLGLAIHRVYSQVMPKPALALLGSIPPVRYLSIAITYGFFIVSGILFVAPSLAVAAADYLSMFHFLHR